MYSGAAFFCSSATSQTQPPYVGASNTWVSVFPTFSTLGKSQETCLHSITQLSTKTDNHHKSPGEWEQTMPSASTACHIPDHQDRNNSHSSSLFANKAIIKATEPYPFATPDATTDMGYVEDLNILSSQGKPGL